MELYDTNQAAERLNLDPSHVRRLARDLAIGRRIGWAWLFTAADLRLMRRRRDGRHKK